MQVCVYFEGCGAEEGCCVRFVVEKCFVVVVGAGRCGSSVVPVGVGLR
jgi:hypothetical protein